ncbi:MAG: class I SAM-dependent methyltransferase [Rhodospirillales bacterium]
MRFNLNPFRRMADPLSPIADAYTLRLKQYGASPRGVLWNNLEGQRLRFELMVSMIGPGFARQGLSINDLGCGYGAFFDYLSEFPAMRGGRYFGYDLCKPMVQVARARVADPRAQFIHASEATHEADYSFASGTFSMKLKTDRETWKSYVFEGLKSLWAMTAKGMAFNMLDISGQGRTTWLFYADPGEFLDFAMRELSPQATVLDSAPLNEWTMLVKR